MSPKVSVLMSVYNNEATVDASIASIVNQTFTDWELILWDDASTDGTAKKLKSWELHDSRIRLFSNAENLGLAPSLNLALAQAQGCYIARMDGDDESLPERFQKQTAFLDTHREYALVGSACTLFDDAGDWGKRSGNAAPQKKDFLWGSQFIHPAVMLRRDALTVVGGYRVCRDTVRTEDYDLFMRLYAHGFTGYNLAEPLLRYRDNRVPRRVRFAHRLNEVKIRFRGFKALGLLPVGLPYVLKPIAVAMLPGGLKRRLQHNRHASKEGSL